MADNKSVLWKPAATRHSTEDLKIAPDGGWGWTVVFASFMIHAIADGVTYTFGIFYVELLYYFGESKSTTSWVASIMVGITFCIGPIASALTNKLGCRIVTIAGALIATVGLILSLIVPRLPFLFITIGICTGSGFGLMYVPSIVSVTCYFDKKRAFATGIAVCGSGLGTFALAPIIELLVDYYGWKGAMLLASGFVLNCVVFGALFRPLQPVKKLPPGISSSVYSASPSETVNDTTEFRDAAKRSERRRNWEVSSLVGSGFFSLSPTADSSDRSRKALLPATDVLAMRRRSDFLVTSSPLRRNTEGSIFSHSDVAVTDSTKELQYSKQSGLLYQKDILYSGSLLNIPEYRSNPDLYYLTVSSVDLKENLQGNQSKFSWCPKEISEAFFEMVDFSLMKNPVFLLFAASNFLTSIGFNVPYVYTKDRVDKMGIATEDDASFLLSIIGISNTVGRVTLGYLSDRSWINRLYLYNGCLVISGLATVLSCYATNYILMSTYCVVFGAATGACVSLTSIILVQLFGIKKLTNAFGLLLLFVGMACFIGPPITGSLYDRLGSYNPGFYLSGAVIATSGCLLFLTPLIQNRTQKHLSAQGGKGDAASRHSVLPCQITVG